MTGNSLVTLLFVDKPIKQPRFDVWLINKNDTNINMLIYTWLFYRLIYKQKCD